MLIYLDNEKLAVRKWKKNWSEVRWVKPNRRKKDPDLSIIKESTDNIFGRLLKYNPFMSIISLKDGHKITGRLKRAFIEKVI